MIIIDFIYQEQKIYYEEIGKGETIIFLHGWGATHQTFIKQYALSNQYHLYILDLPGFGQSDEPNKIYKLDDYVQMLFAFINKIINEPSEKINIVAHSFGGRIAIKYASMYDIKKLVLIASAGIKKNKTLKQKWQIAKYKIQKKWYQLTKNYLEYNYLLRKNGSNDYLNATIKMKEIMKKVINEDLVKHLKRIRCPVLLIWGCSDTETPLEDGFIMRQKIPNVHMVTISHATHFVYLEEAEQVNRLICGFLGDNSD